MVELATFTGTFTSFEWGFLEAIFVFGKVEFGLQEPDFVPQLYTYNV